MVEPRNGFIIFQGREARGKLVIGYLNIIWQFARTGNNVMDGSSTSNICYVFGVFAILMQKLTSNENKNGQEYKSSYYNVMFPSDLIHIGVL